MPISQTEAYFETKPLKKGFSSVKTKTNLILPQNLLKGATTHLYRLFDQSHFSIICTFKY